VSPGQGPWTFTDADMNRLRALTREAAALYAEAVARSTETIEASRAVLREWHAVHAEPTGEARTRELRCSRRGGGPA
jgi:hypothetical protein